MDVNHILEVYIHKLPVIIQVLFVLILVLIGSLIVFSLRKRDSDQVSGTSIEGLETTLRKVIENTQHLSKSDGQAGVANAATATDGHAPTPAAVAATGAVAALPAEDVLKLQADLKAKEQRMAELVAKISELEKATAAAVAAGGAAGAPTAGGGGADAAGLEAKLKDLEARLKEYEIIEDDIANLSLYKEENIRLKNELNKAGGAPAGSAPAAPTPPVAEATPEPKGESLEDALAKAGGLPNIEVPKPEPAAAPAAVAAAEPQEDLVSQLASVVGGQAPPTPAAPAQAQAPAPAATVAAASTPAPEGEVPDALKGFDADKIMDEATKLVVDENAANAKEEGDPGQKLIDEFENFMKESGS